MKYKESNENYKNDLMYLYIINNKKFRVNYLLILLSSIHLYAFVPEEYLRNT